MLADTDFPWVIVVMMFIAFVQWIMGKLRGTEEVLPDATTEEIPDEEFQRPRPRTVASAPPPIPQPQPKPQAPPAAPTTLQEWRRLLETMREAQEAAAKPAPPPVPAPAPKAPPAPVSIPAPAPAPPLRVTTTRNGSKTAPGSLRITPKSIRDAVILKEILDPPVSLRDDWDR